jgi:molecular chaperone HtpG
LLSVFMVADEVDIITCHPQEESARHLSLRSVSGKYLIRLLDKSADPVALSLVPHGTLVRLKVRPRAEIKDIVQTAEKWIVIPDAQVLIKLDDDEPFQIGHTSPAGALRALLARYDYDLESGNIKIEEKQLGGVQLAYAVQWSEYFREWSFLSTRKIPDVDDSGEDEEEEEAQAGFFGTCIEGIRVEFFSPGFMDLRVAAIANARGSSAPKTNVVRSGLEITPERDRLLLSIYKMYCGHVGDEIELLHRERGFSVTWAAQEAEYLLRPLIGRERGDSRETGSPLSSRLLTDAVKDVSLILVEVAGRREPVSLGALEEAERIWTIDCAFFALQNNL